MARPGSRLRMLRYYLISFYGAWRLAKNQADSKYLYYITDAQDSIDEMYNGKDPSLKSFATEEMNQLWKERYFPPTYDLDALLKLPPNSFGHIYASHMRQHNLTPDFYIQYRNLTPEGCTRFFNDKIRYIRFRISQTHDIWHVLAGYDTSSLGEAGLQGFYLGQFHSGFSVFIYLISLIATLGARQFDSLEKSLDLFYQGYKNGKKAKFMLSVKWEDHWAEDIDAVRARYNITPVVYDVEEVKELSRRRPSVFSGARSRTNSAEGGLHD